MSGEQFETYIVEYSHAGRRWGAQIKATSFEDAQERCRQIYYAHVLGVLVAEIPAACGGGLLSRLYCWIRNVLCKEAAA